MAVGCLCRPARWGSALAAERGWPAPAPAPAVSGHFLHRWPGGALARFMALPALTATGGKAGAHRAARAHLREPAHRALRAGHTAGGTARPVCPRLAGLS